MLQTLRLIASCCTALTLVACGQAPQMIPKVAPESRAQYLTNLQNWEITGKVGVRNKEEGHNLSMDWKQARNQYHIRFYGTFIADSAILDGDSKQVTLRTSDGKTYENSDPGKLLQEHLGWSLPFANLAYWIKGMAAPNSKAQAQKFDQHHQLQSMQQDGWLVKYDEYVVFDGMTLPEKLSLSNGETSIKLVIHEWKK